MRGEKPVRMTVQRQIILDELRTMRTHPTADELYARVRIRLPRISLGTVYRNLELLAAQGKIRKLDGAGPQRRFDFNPESHHHVRCVECGAVDDATMDSPLCMDDFPETAGGYKILAVRIEWLGLCPRCLIKRDNPC